MTLAQVAQDDFAVGMLRGLAPDTQPGIGLYSAVNGLYNDDGDVFRRGGTRLYSGAGPAPLTFIWTGFLAGQPKILLADASDFYTLDGSLNLSAIGGAGLAGPVQCAVVKDKLYLPTGEVYDGTTIATWTPPVSLPPGPSTHVCASVGRLIVACGNRVAFSEADNPASFIADDFHDLPGGVVVMGMASLRDTVFVFTNFGLWTISNMAFNLTDAAGNIQQTLSLLTPEVSLWHESGVCEWAGRLVAPCADRAFIIDGISAPQPITDSIAPFYMSFVRGGRRPGGAKVFRNTLFLPILNGAVVEALLVCRLHRPVKGRYLYFPWSVFTGHGMGMVMGDVDLRGAAPRFLAAHRSGRVVNYTDIFNPTEAIAADADGSVHEFDVETRDYPTGNGQPNHVRRLRMRYTLDGVATVTAGYSTGSRAQTYEQGLHGTYADVKAEYASYSALRVGPGWDSGLPLSEEDPSRVWTTLGDLKLSEPGIDPAAWRFRRAVRTRFVRVRLRSESPIARIVVHRIELSVRQATHAR